MANDTHRVMKDADSKIPIPQFKDKDSGIFKPHTGGAAPFYQMLDTDGNIVGRNNPLMVDNAGTLLAEQKTQSDAVTGKLTFSKNIYYISIYNRDTVNDGVFNVNGINITVPKGEAVDFRVGGTPKNTVSITGSTLYIVSRFD